MRGQEEVIHWCQRRRRRRSPRRRRSRAVL